MRGVRGNQQLSEREGKHYTATLTLVIIYKLGPTPMSTGRLPDSVGTTNMDGQMDNKHTFANNMGRGVKHTFAMKNEREGTSIHLQ